MSSHLTWSQIFVLQEETVTVLTGKMSSCAEDSLKDLKVNKFSQPELSTEHWAVCSVQSALCNEHLIKILV